MSFVPMKTADQQAALMLVGLRESLIRNRTQLADAIRGFAMVGAGAWPGTAGSRKHDFQ